MTAVYTSCSTQGNATLEGVGATIARSLFLRITGMEWTDQNKRCVSPEAYRMECAMQVEISAAVADEDGASQRRLS
jgi:hypothetical protein